MPRRMVHSRRISVDRAVLGLADVIMVDNGTKRAVLSCEHVCLLSMCHISIHNMGGKAMAHQRSS